MRNGARFRRQGTIIALAALLAGAPPRPASASGQGQSSSGSSNGSDSSKGSGDSSNSSNDSSKSSEDSSHSSDGSSKDSDNSTQNSPKNSSDYTTDHTTKGSTDWTTHSHGAHVFSVVMVVVAVGATVLGIALTDRSRSGPPPAAALAGFMRRQHAMLLHDVSTGDGPVLDAWAHDLRLTVVEKRRLRRVLDGSEEQDALIDALDGTIDDAHAERFGAAFVRVTDRALGRTRTRALVARAISASRGS
jgi:hypothetical protein